MSLSLIATKRDTWLIASQIRVYIQSLEFSSQKKMPSPQAQPPSTMRTCLQGNYSSFQLMHASIWNLLWARKTTTKRKAPFWACMKGKKNVKTRLWLKIQKIVQIGEKIFCEPSKRRSWWTFPREAKTSSLGHLLTCQRPILKWPFTSLTLNIHVQAYLIEAPLKAAKAKMVSKEMNRLI